MRTLIAAVLFVLLASVTSGCSGEHPTDPAPSQSGPALAMLGTRTISTTGVSMIDLGPGCGPFDLNNAGVAVGWHIQSGQGHACILDRGETLDLGDFGGRNSSARAINARGEVVVYVSGPDRALLWANGSTTPLSPIVVGTDINARGQVVGRSAGFPGPFRGLLWDHGNVVDLGDLGGGYSFPFAMNDRGQVVGWSGSGTRSYHAFLWTAGEMADLGTMRDGWSSEAVAINNRGDVVVHDRDFSRIPVPSRPWLYSNGTRTDLGTIAGDHMHAADINNRGQIVGDYAQNRAWFWDQGQMIELGHLPGARASVALSIDDAGRVMGVSGGSVVIWLP